MKTKEISAYTNVKVAYSTSMQFKNCTIKDTSDGIRIFYYEIDSNGKKVQRKKRAKTMAQAKEIAKQIDSEISSHGLGKLMTLSQDDKNAIEFFYSKQRDMSLSQFINAFIAQSTHPFKGKDISDACNEFIKYKVASNVKNTAHIKKRINVFLEHFKGKIVGQISKNQIIRWLQSLELAPKTVNHYRDTIKELFRYMSLEDVVKNLPLAKGLENDKDIYSLEEIIKIIIHFKEHHEELFPSVAIMLFTGMRVSEILTLKWEDFDLTNLEDDEIALNSNKTGKRLAFLPSICKQWLITCCKRKGQIFKHNTTIKDPLSKLSKGILSAMPSDVPKKMNGFRHTYATMKFSFFKNASDIAGELGNSVQMLRKHYVQPTLKKESQLFWQLTPSYIELLRMAQNPSIESKQFYNYKDSKLLPPSEKLAKNAINEALTKLVKKTDEASIENKLDLILKKLEQ